MIRVGFSESKESVKMELMKKERQLLFGWEYPSEQDMKCTCFEYHELTDGLFYSAALTDEHLNKATEKIRRYLIDGGAAQCIHTLGIGIQITTKSALLLPDETVKRRFVWLDGARKGKELTIHELESIGMFLKGGAFFGKQLI